MKVWRPYHRGTVVIEPRLGSGFTPGGVFIETGADRPTRVDERFQLRDLEKQVEMVGDVTMVYGTDTVEPGDTVVFEYGAEHVLIDARGERLVCVAEKSCMVMK